MKNSIVDNQDGNTMASVLKHYLQSLREESCDPKELQIASAFFNPYGFNLIAKELENIPKIKLLLGAEPEPEAIRKQRLPGDPHNFFELQVKKNISNLDAALRINRNSLPFNIETDDAIRNLLQFLDSDQIEVRRYTHRFLHAKAFLFLGEQKQLITGSSNLTYAGLKNNIELNLTINDFELLEKVHDWYTDLWNDSESYDLAEIYRQIFEDYSPYEIYLSVLWQLYGEELLDETEEEGDIKLSRFQQHGVKRALRILDKYHGVMIADGVGLGKTYLGLAIMQTFVERKERVLVICPAALCNMWEGVLSDSQLFSEVISYNKFRDDSQFGGLNDYLKRNIEEYALVVIDEAHNYRSEDTDNAKALRELLRQRKKLVLLTATPVNNGIMDLRVLLSYFLKQDASLSDEGITSLMERFKTADSIEPGKLNPDILYPIIDSTTVKRPRNFVKEFYSGDTLVGKDGQPFTITFPNPIPKKVTYELSELNPNFFDELKDVLMPETGEPKLTLARYKADNYLKGKKRLIRIRGLRKNARIITSMELVLSDQSVFLFESIDDNPLGLVLEDAFRGLRVIEIDNKICPDLEVGDMVKSINGKKTRYLKEIKTVLSNTLSLNQENAASGLLRSNLLKRFESSIHSFSLTLGRLVNSYQFFIDTIEKGKVPLREYFQEFSVNDDNDDIDSLLTNENIMEDIINYDIERFKSDLQNDLQILLDIQKEIDIDQAKSSKLIELNLLLKSILKKAEEDSFDDTDARQKRKVMIFSYFEETTDWIRDYLEKAIGNDPELAPYKNRLAVISGKTQEWEGLPKDEVINRFAPISMEAKEGTEDKYDLMICTDVLAEGLNLQQCRNIINYDLPWNPMRLVQRHGRIDRLKSPHSDVYMYSFFPDNRLDDLLQLEQRIRNKIAVASASIGVEVTPIVDGAQSEITFSDTMDEINRIYEEDSSIFEQGGTNQATQTGEIYRAELRRAINQYSIQVDQLPRRIGSGLRKSLNKSQESGFFFCAEINYKDENIIKSRTLLRFVPENCNDPEEIIVELASCLRMIECTKEEETLPINNKQEGAYASWDLAKESIFEWWQERTDPANLQPKIPKINREVSDFLIGNPPHDINQEKFNNILSSVEAPWRVRDSRLLREVWNREFSSNAEKAIALSQEIIKIGVEPYIAPKPLVSIENTDIDLICWMYIESEKTK